MNEYPHPAGQPARLALSWPHAVAEQIAEAVADRLREGDLVPAHSAWLDVAGAAAYLGMTPDAVRKAAQLGLPPAHQPFGKGSRYFFHHRELDEPPAADVAGTGAANGSRA